MLNFLMIKLKVVECAEENHIEQQDSFTCVKTLQGAGYGSQHL
jgi:hypothetical protein